MIYIKIHNTDNGDIIAMCDSDLLGKVLKEGEFEINLKDYSDFYKGELANEEKAVKMLKPERLSSANIVGKESVSAAVKAMIIDKSSIKKVERIPYAYAFRIKY
jgi:uncharacterized protein